MEKCAVLYDERVELGLGKILWFELRCPWNNRILGLQRFDPQIELREVARDLLSLALRDSGLLERSQPAAFIAKFDCHYDIVANFDRSRPGTPSTITRSYRVVMRKRNR